MYNSEKKSSYLQKLKDKGYSNTYIQNTKEYFKKVSVFETELHKDVADFTLNEILCMYSQLNLRVNKIMELTTRLRAYSYEETGFIGDYAKITRAFIKDNFK